MTIEWNRVTWYSWAAALIIFVGTFALAFCLGIRWEKAQIGASLSPTPQAGGLGAHCGGFIKDAPQCAEGFHCVLNVSRPDTGGTCQADAVSNGAPMLPVWVGDMKVIDAQSNGTTVTLAKNERFAIRFGSELDWTLSFSPASAVTRVPGSTTDDGFQGVYEADAAGTATLTATGRPICKTGEMCPQFIVEDTVTLVVQ